MREILQQQVEGVKAALTEQYPEFDLNVVPAMTYGNPGIGALLQQLAENPQDHLILLPLFPQYSATSTAPLYDALAKWIPQQRNLPGLSVIRDYYQHPLFIQSLAQSVRDYQAAHGQPEKLLMSFHGIPQPYADKGDPYAERCRVTAQLLAAELGLSDQQWVISFQSRFGKQEWVKPYTDALLQQWGGQGVQSVQVISPAFSADCLETLEEIALEGKQTFLAAGGGEFRYIPCLNDHPDWIAALGTHIIGELGGWLPVSNS